MKRVWIINQYIGTPSMGVDGHRHYYFARKLAERGYGVSLLTSSFSHVPKKDIQLDSSYQIDQEEGYTLGLIKTPKYGSARGIGRIWSMLVFMLKLFFFPFSKLQRPDIVIVSSISLLPILNGLLLRRKYGCKLILEIRDIWPLSIIELGGFKKYNPFVAFLRWVEIQGYKKYDYITSLLPLTKNHIEESLGHSNFNFEHIPNGIFLEEKEEVIPLNQTTFSKIPTGKFIIGYSGTLGVANAMEPIMNAANKCDGDVAFCIVGDGYEKANLQELADNKNVLFFDPIPKSEIVSLLENFDVLILSWQDVPLYRFGVSANKIFDYMYSGKPIIMAGNIGDNVIEIAKCGIVVGPNDSDAILKAIESLKGMSVAERKIIGERGKNYVLENNTFEILTSKYEKIFSKL